jgi:hypothetical protein
MENDCLLIRKIDDNSDFGCSEPVELWLNGEWTFKCEEVVSRYKVTYCGKTINIPCKTKGTVANEMVVNLIQNAKREEKLARV